MSRAILNFNEGTTISIESQMARLALEASAIANVISTFREVVPSLSVKLNEVYNIFTSTFQEEQSISKIKKEHALVVRKTQHVPFSTYDKTLVSVPEGFKGNLLDFTLLLNKLAPEVFVEANKILGEYNFALSAFITNRENKISLKDHTDLFHRVQRRREQMTDEMSKFFTKDSTSKAYLGGILNRFADLEDVLEQLYRLETARNKHNLEAIASSVKKSVDLLNIITKDIQDNGVTNVSGAAAMNISSGAYELAKYVEFISLFRYRTEQTITSVKKLVETLDNILK